MNSLTGRTLGRYQLLDHIGQGGMATVYKAYDPEQDRHVALKVLSPALAQQEQFIQRFRREAGVVVQLRHPHIVPVEYFGEEGGYSYLVMPYIEGGSLADHLMNNPPSSTFGARVVEQVASALQYAHGRGVVHRDVKPANILIDEEGNALLADFGLARIHDASSSLTGSALIGTPAYYLLAKSMVEVEQSLFAGSPPGRARTPATTPNALPAPRGRRPHVLFVMIDTLRADALDSYREGPVPMPRFARWVDESLAFSNVMANSSWTKPSVGSFFTGRLPEEHGAVDRGDRLPADQLTLAEALGRSGYRTAAFVTNFAHVGHATGFDQGFDHFVELG